MSNSFKIHTLGCGSAKPTLRHQPSCTVVEHHGNLYMIDCGEGAQLAFQHHHLKFSRLAHIFLTHLHGDHVFGLPGLVGTLGLAAMGGKLTIHTFEEGRRVLQSIFDYFSHDTPFDIEYNIIDPTREQIALETKNLIIRTVPLRHRVDAVGYVFEEKPSLPHIIKSECDFHGVPLSQYQAIKEGADFRKDNGLIIPNSRLVRPAAPPLSYAHLTDTSYFPELAASAGPVTLMMHETTYCDQHLADAAKRGHSTARQAATTARDAGAKWLLTGHYSSRYRDDNQFAEEARTIFPNVITNREGLVIDLNTLR